MVLGKGRQAYCTSSIRHKIEERPNKWNDATIGCDAIGDRTHPMFTDTIANVSALVTPKSCVLRLEINRTLDFSEIAARQVCRAAEEIWKHRSDCGESDL